MMYLPFICKDKECVLIDYNEERPNYRKRPGFFNVRDLIGEIRLSENMHPSIALELSNKERFFLLEDGPNDASKTSGNRGIHRKSLWTWNGFIFIFKIP